MINRLFDLRCPDCGGRITEEDQHCPNCGADLNAPVTPALSVRQYFDLAQEAYDNGGDLSDALNDCDLAIQQQHDWAEVHNLRGLILDALGRPDEAILSYREAVRLNPSLEDASANLADAEGEQRNRAEVANQKRTGRGVNWTAIILGGAGAVLLVLLCALAYLFYSYGMQYLGPRQVLIFEPDPSLITSAVTPSELEEAAQILTERAAQLGYRRITFVVSENGEITARVPSQVDIESFSARIAPIGLIEFVDFGETGMAVGERVATDLDDRFLQQSEGTRYHTLMSNDEIQYVSVVEDVFGKPAVQFTLTEKGRNLFSEYTSRNIGKYLGIVRDKVVVSCPVISTAITDGQGIIQGAFSKQEVEDLTAILQTKPLPIPIRVKQAVESE